MRLHISRTKYVEVFITRQNMLSRVRRIAFKLIKRESFIRKKQVKERGMDENEIWMLSYSWIICSTIEWGKCRDGESGATTRWPSVVKGKWI